MNPFAETLASLIASYADPSQTPGFDLGPSPLERIIGKAQPGQVYVLAGPPSSGKSTYALNVAEDLAVDGQVPVGFFTLEASAKALCHQLLCSRARINSTKVLDGLLRGDELARLSQAASEIEAAPLFVDDRREVSLEALDRRATWWCQQNGVQMLFIDCLQLLRSTSDDEEQVGYERKVALVSEGLVDLARKLNVPILVTCRLEEDPDKTPRKPRLADVPLDVAYDADVILLLDRPELRLNGDNDEAARKLDGVAELIVAKQRHGSTGALHLTFCKEAARFQERLPEHDELSDGIFPQV